MTGNSARITVERQNAVAVLMLVRGVTNAIDPQLVAELAEQLWTLRDDPGVRGLVLTSASDKFFSIGFDLPRLVPLTREEFAAFFRAFNRLSLDLFAFPGPTVAALPGHAIAGGCILALSCDYRYMAEGRKLMGLNEVKLGVPVPFAADRMLTRLVGDRAARDIMYGGDFFAPADLLALGLVDRLLPLDRLVPEAVARAARLAAPPGDGFARIKRNRVGSVLDEILARLEDEERLFVESWYAPAARAQLQEAMAKF